MFEFKHPKFYKELRKRNKSAQVISHSAPTGANSRRAPGRGLKQQASSSKLRYTPTGILLGVDLGDKPQASSSKQQASSAKLLEK
jgi:hypothetical protein